MSVRIRFLVWAVCIAAQLVLLPAWFAAGKWWPSPIVSWAGLAISIALTAAVVVLILTTPPNAIRLSPRRSLAWIAVGTVWLFGWQAGLQSPSASSTVGAIAAVFGVTVLARAAILREWSPWVASCIAWSAFFVGPFAVPVRFSGWGLLMIAVLWFGMNTDLKRTKLTP